MEECNLDKCQEVRKDNPSHTYIWYCRLVHINEIRIAKLHKQDNHCRFGYVYLMKYKSEAFEKFKEFRAKVEKQTEKRACGSKIILEEVQEPQTSIFKEPKPTVEALDAQIDALPIDKEPTSDEEAISDIDFDKWLKAMKTEMDAMYVNQVWTLVDVPKGVKPITCKWICKRKTEMDGNVQMYKARLVAKGYNRVERIDYEETFSPIAMIKSIRMLLAIAIYYDNEIWKMDVKIIFLNENFQKEVYTIQLEGFTSKESQHKVCKLQKSIYGLKQASRSWNIRFNETIKEYDFVKNPDDPFVYKKIYRDRSKRLLGLSQSTYIDKVLKRTKDVFLVYGVAELQVKVYEDAASQSNKDDSKSQSGLMKNPIL
ncbi:Reverse transcriptase [Theobroma cacao]|nr:Reverse transcriptase [Theobroma cacao]